MSNKTFKQRAKEFNKLYSDAEKWHWIILHKDEIELVLDNDQTFGYLINEDDERESLGKFEFYVGNSVGVKILLDAIGIKSEGA